MGQLETKTPAMLIKDYLVADGRAALFTGWEFKFGKMPPEGDQMIVLIDQAGQVTFPHLLVDWLGLQILVRSKSAKLEANNYQVAYLLMRKIRDILLGVGGHPAEFTELDGIVERTNIVPLGYDDQDRHTWSWNCRMLVEPEANALTNRVSL